MACTTSGRVLEAAPLDLGGVTVLKAPPLLGQAAIKCFESEEGFLEPWESQPRD
jgi:hypothetical protein